MKKIVLASGNTGKIREIADIFAELEIEIVAQSSLGIESPEESGETFEENALLKASFAAELSGLPAMAYDSVMSVDALDGRIPVIAVGGIMTAADAARKLQAGAALVQIYTGFIYAGPKLIADICRKNA